MIDISIIIPTLNRANTLRTTLSSIINQPDLSGLEIFVIDNGSTDNTAEVVQQFTYEKIDVQYHYDAESGLLTGRHLGASLAKGKILCFLDDDVELHQSWVEGVRDAFGDQEVQLATGPCLPKYEIEPPEWLQYFWQPNSNGGRSCSWLSLIDLGDEIKNIHPTNVWGLNFCIRKEAFISLGGFHPDNVPANLQRYQGDGETGLTLKATNLNYKSIYHPKIKLDHLISAERLSINYFKKRAFYQGVCDSYSALREKHLGNENNGVFTSVKRVLSQVKRSISTKKQVEPAEITELKALLKDEEKKGFLFHQEAFKSDQKIREWVLRKDYHDYKLPR